MTGAQTMHGVVIGIVKQIDAQRACIKAELANTRSAPASNARRRSSRSMCGPKATIEIASPSGRERTSGSSSAQA